MKHLNITKDTIILDADGVMFDYITPFIRWINNDASPNLTGGKQVHYPDQYDLSKAWGIDWPDLTLLINEFGRSPYFGHLPVLDDSLLSALTKAKTYGFDIQVLTQVTGSPMARMNRLDNIERCYGNVISNVVFTSFGEKKIDYIAPGLYSKSRDIYFLDDSPKVIEECILDKRQYGHNLLLYPILHEYNSQRMHEMADSAPYLCVGWSPAWAVKDIIGMHIINNFPENK